MNQHRCAHQRANKSKFPAAISRAVLRPFVFVFFALCSSASVQVGAAPQAATEIIQTIPIAAYGGGSAMVQTAVTALNSKLDLDFRFLDKEYKNDVYARDPITGKKFRISCVRYKADSGFRFKVDPVQYSLTNQGLTVSQNIAKIRYDGLTFKFQFGPCAWVGASSLGVQLTDVKFVYKAKPLLKFGEGGVCELIWNNDPNNLSMSIGDLNIIGVQNDIDKLAKDAVREAINFVLDAGIGMGLRGELQKVVVNTCGASKASIKIR